MVLDAATTTAGAIMVLVVSAVILVVLGLVFFLVNLWIIDFAARLLNLTADGSMIVLSAAILSAASMIGSKHR